MKPQSAKQKGRSLQQAVRDKLLDHAPELSSRDIISTSMGAPGCDLLLSEAAHKVYPFAAECKNVESLNIWSAIKQAKANAEEGSIPAVFFKRNRTRVFICMALEDYLELHHEKM